MLVSDLGPKRRTVLIVDLVGRDRMMFIHVGKILWSKVRCLNQHKKLMTLFFCKEKESISSRWQGLIKNKFRSEGFIKAVKDI